MSAATSPQPTDDDFLDGFLNLLPTGPVWPKGPRAAVVETYLAPGPALTTEEDFDILTETGQPITVGELVALRPTEPVLVQACRPLIQLYTRNAARALHLLQDAFPVAPVELLPEWEDTLGLPDPCAGPAPSLQVRQQQVAARFVASGGQTTAYFIKVAASLGYTITIDEFAPYRVGQPVEQPVYGEQWAWVWRVNAPQFTITRFLFGQNSMGDPFASWSNNILQCELNRLKPAQTVLIFSYS